MRSPPRSPKTAGPPARRAESRRARAPPGDNGDMAMKKTELEKRKGKKIAAGVGAEPGGQGGALDRRAQALQHKRALLERMAARKRRDG